MAQGVKVEAEADRKRNKFLAEFQTTYLIDLMIIIKDGDICYPFIINNNNKLII